MPDRRRAPCDATSDEQEGHGLKVDPGAVDVTLDWVHAHARWLTLPFRSTVASWVGGRRTPHSAIAGLPLGRYGEGRAVPGETDVANDIGSTIPDLGSAP